METSFLVILTFLLFQRFGTSSGTIITSSSNVTCIEKERQSLLLLKKNLIDRFNLLSTWSGVECCVWRGVECDSQNGRVVKLDLRPPVPSNIDTLIINEKRLEGELAPSLKNLKYLRYLDLSMNHFLGNIPEFLGSFESMEYLNLSASGFEDGVIPHHLGNLSRLQYLDLRSTFVIDNHHLNGPSFFRFSAPVVKNLGWVSSLSSLRHLDLSGIRIGKHIDWLHTVNMLPSLLILNLVGCDIINIPTIKFVNFTSLNSLDLSLNDINSMIPVWLSNLTGLIHLNLQDNHFHGKIPYFLGKFSDLASIDLSYNSFDTSMPNLLCNLSSLIQLDLSGNMLSGTIPATIGRLWRLEGLNLHHNRLIGNIPMSIGQLSMLNTLDVHDNSLVGVLSKTHFAKLKNLIYLDLSWNSLALNISSQWIAPFRLQIFIASSCNIGPHFPNWLLTQTNLQMLDLSNSSIRDTISEGFENIFSQIRYLDLSNNHIGGKLPQLHVDINNQTKNRFLIMNSNKFEGSLITFPSNVQILDLSDNLLTGHVPQTDGIMNPRKLPGCLGNLINLHAIDVSYNTITGAVPSSLGSLKHLILLHLHNNRFDGDIPMSLQNLTVLVTMDFGNNLLTGTIPFWIGEKLSELRFLDLQSNKFTGKIPPQLCRLKSLQYFNLAHNNITGTIPRCFGTLSGMIMNSVDLGYYEDNILVFMKGIQLEYTTTIRFLTSLDLSSNNITGEIPDVLMNLVGLKNINLSRNQLKGHIPMTIGNLSQMESLDLSMNMLYGRIPQSLTSLNFLSYLNLSHNNLSGPIPVGNQLQTLADPSIYEGNNGLCGPPVSSSCKRNNSSYNHHVGEDEVLWFYSGMGSGFVAGFTGLVGSLYFIQTWRLSYFDILANVYGWLSLLFLLNHARLRRMFF